MSVGQTDRPAFGGQTVTATVDRDPVIAAILPSLRGAVSSNRRVMAHVERSDEALAFANSAWAERLCRLGTSCPDHFLRTRISPMFVPWDPAAEGVPELQHRMGERLIQVCEGVQHAHQKAVIHRDLKPSNVLVSLLDGRAAIKIIDFGVAKAVAQRTERTLYTEHGVMIGTPEYMSPEQAEMTGQDVDTISRPVLIVAKDSRSAKGAQARPQELASLQISRRLMRNSLLLVNQTLEPMHPGRGVAPRRFHLAHACPQLDLMGHAFGKIFECLHFII